MKAALLLLLLSTSTNLLANQNNTVNIYSLNADPATRGIGDVIGTIAFIDTDQGLSLTINVKDISPGEHGFHVHENPSCEFQEKDGQLVPGLAAGGHYDPANAQKHLGPNSEGHLGDLPKLTADSSGTVQQTVIAPRLREQDLKNRAFIIHQSGDNYSDNPNPLGGGGARIACGVIE